jgi:dipeptidyl aminopeptidase/acylaminoacyl peptidase
MKYPPLLTVLLVIFTNACASVTPQTVSTIAITPATQPTPAVLAAAGAPASTPTATAPPGPFQEYSIEHLRAREYGGELAQGETLGQNSAFVRQLFRYDSDGLSISGFADVPHGQGPFPVIIALHGYIDPGIYQTLDYTTHYADALASNGYLVLHPNLRGYPPSDTGENLFRVGMAIDVLNLIAIVKEQSGRTGLLQAADPDLIGLWGHSMGAGVSTRVLTVSPDISAAVLYAAMSGDERVNYEAIYRWLDGTMGTEELAVPPEALTAISPMYFLDAITAPVSIHHGLEDRLVPVGWSMQTCEQLKSLGKTVECHYYEGMPHTFFGPVEKEFMQYTLQFYDRYLRSP